MTVNKLVEKQTSLEKNLLDRYNNQLKKDKSREGWLAQAHKTLLAYQRQIDAHMFNLRGHSELGHIMSNTNDVMNNLVSRGIALNNSEVIYAYGGPNSNIEIELGCDLAANELGKINDANTPKESAKIKKLHRFVQDKPDKLFTYINTWERGKRGPIQQKFAVRYTNPLTVESIISRYIYTIDNTISTISKNAMKAHLAINTVASHK